MPDSYQVGTDLSQVAFPFNGLGWDLTSGETKAAVALFVQDPTRLAIEVAPAAGSQVEAADYEQIQAKIGLEFLSLEKSVATKDGRMLIFRGPRSKRYQTGLQVAFLGFVTPEKLSVGRSDFRLLRVDWR